MKGIEPARTDFKTEDPLSASFDKIEALANLKQEAQRLISPMVFVALISFFNGLNQIRGIGEFMYQKDVLQLSPAWMQIMLGVVTIPNNVKFVLGWGYDWVLYRIKKSKFVVLVCALVRVFTSVMLLYANKSVWSFMLLMLLTTLGDTFERIVCECTLVVSTKRANEEADGQSAKSNHMPVFFGFRSAGSLVGLFLGGRIVHSLSLNALFFVSALMPIFLIVTALAYAEVPPPPREAKQDLKGEWATMKEVFRKPRVAAMLLFLFLIHLTPSYDFVTSFYLMDVLKFTTEDLANLSSFSLLMFIAGLAWYSCSLYRQPPKRTFMATNFVLWAINCSFLLVVFNVVKRWGVSERLFCLVSAGANSLVVELNSMPILAIWCSFCPENLEATAIAVFSTLMALSFNFGTWFGIVLSFAFRVERGRLDSFWLLLVIQHGFLILVLVLIAMVGFPDPSERIEAKDQDAIITDN